LRKGGHKFQDLFESLEAAFNVWQNVAVFVKAQNCSQSLAANAAKVANAATAAAAINPTLSKQPQSLRT